MKTVLFVAYGSGHIKMVLPVAQALANGDKVKPLVLALTTAAPVARAAGLEVIQFKDFVTAADVDALQLGRQLVEEIEGLVDDPQESIAYLGLSMADLIDAVGAEQAEASYRKFGRQAFLPTKTLARILSRVAPDLVVATNSPRAERAAILAARQQSIPSICMVDLFAMDEVRWIGAPDYADHVCVLNESVRTFLLNAGRRADEVSVTGNPGFDVINSLAARDQGRLLREKHCWRESRVILWPNQTEPAFHPFDGRAGDSTLPQRALDQVTRWVLSRHDSVLCIRHRAGQEPSAVSANPRIVYTGQNWPLAPLLHATDLVITIGSTVGIEGHLAGCRLIQVTGSVFDDAMPLKRFGIADAVTCINRIPQELDRWVGAPRLGISASEPATDRVLSVLEKFI